MTQSEKLTVILKHTWAEPKFVAQIEWMHDHPDPISQMFAQLGSRPVSKSDDDVRGWLEDVADEEVSFVVHEQPDWDWWEPTSEWRRKHARDRELDALLS
jgi:hypothetical protein